MRIMERIGINQFEVYLNPRQSLALVPLPVPISQLAPLDLAEQLDQLYIVYCVIN